MSRTTPTKQERPSPMKLRFLWPLTAIFLAGCAGLPGLHLFGLILLFASAVSFSSSCNSNTSNNTTTDIVADTSCSGAWEACCSDGLITTCCCPDGMACNYGWFTNCGDNTCTLGEECGTADATSTDAAVSDATNTDAGCDGLWEPCCVDGAITECCCPDGGECNYGMFEDCGDGVCAYPGESCEPADTTQTDATATDTTATDTTATDATISDATISDATNADDTGCSGIWEPCCVDGEVTKCCCPDGADCNYGWYTTCDDGSCVGVADSCDDADTSETDATPSDTGDQADAGCDGNWETCCVNNAISTCCCPDGVACNYGMFFIISKIT